MTPAKGRSGLFGPFGLAFRAVDLVKYAAMEKIATDIYTFEELRKEGFTYVDKTDSLYAMASGESGKRINLIGISFSAEKRTIVEELVEEMPA